RPRRLEVSGTRRRPISQRSQPAQVTGCHLVIALATPQAWGALTIGSRHGAVGTANGSADTTNENSENGPSHFVGTHTAAAGRQGTRPRSLDFHRAPCGTGTMVGRPISWCCTRGDGRRGSSRLSVKRQ